MSSTDARPKIFSVAMVERQALDPAPVLRRTDVSLVFSCKVVVVFERQKQGWPGVAAFSWR